MSALPDLSALPDGSADHGAAGPPRGVGNTRLRASSSASAEARAYVVGTLRDWHLEPDALDDAELVVSELVTNAFLHGHAAEVAITLADRGRVVRLEVAHDEPGPVLTTLAPLTVGADETHGRGLAIVDVVSDAWGVERTPGGRRVWAELTAARTGLVPVPDRDDALAALTAALGSATAVRAVGDAVTGWASERLATSFAGVALLDGPSHLRYLSVEPLPESSASAWARFPVDTDAPVAAAFRTGRPYFHESRNAVVAGFPGLGPALEASQMVALAHLPLLDGDRPVGTLALAWSHGRQLDAADRGWLATVTDAVAAAVVRLGAGHPTDALSEG